MKLFLDDLELEESDLSEQIRKVTIALQKHPIYKRVKTIEEIRTYMQFQVWCVWDFMALLKALEHGLIEDKIEWTPPQDGNIGAFIYEILLTEETDITDSGAGRCSHFETYLKAMKQAGADTKAIDTFISNLKAKKGFDGSLIDTGIPDAALKFVKNTMKHAKSDLHKVVSVFCLSREGIIPGMFTFFLSNITLQNNLSSFHWYLKRHIEVDSDSHGPLSVKLFKMVVGSDTKKIDEALKAALDALIARKKFLDSILKQIQLKSKNQSK
ncbi:MAG: DUF3050 domain-containing protein [Chitinophagaceae bacterium]|nr:DUF3050 domain-containing protein [Chitinophagaceae bacterium]